MAFLTIACPCLVGLESVLSGEVKRMGGQDVEVTDGRVCFKGNPRMIARANVLLRTAERVLIVVGGFRAETFQDLFEGVYHLPWEYWKQGCLSGQGMVAQLQAQERSGLSVDYQKSDCQAAG